MPPRRMLWQKGESAVTIRELCEKEVVQLEQGVCLGRADAILVHTAVPAAPAAPHGFWQQLRVKLGL